MNTFVLTTSLILGGLKTKDKYLSGAWQRNC